MTATSLFQPAQVTTAYLKMALMGFQGSGKTFTAIETATGLVNLLRELNLPEGDKPIAFADTEKGSDWILPRVKAQGIEMITAKTRAFSDLLKLVREAEAHASVLVVDSLTHFWVELTETYCARKARDLKRESYRLQFQDWAFLKSEWRKFTDLFINSKCHIILCGRAGFEYDYFEDDGGKKQLEKTGIKLKAEGEMGYEPDILILMERRMNMDTKADEHIAHVVKDRSTILDGKEFADPTFKHFLPHVKCLNLGGKQLGVDTSRTSAASIPRDAPRDRSSLQRSVVLDEINDILMRHGAGGTSAADKLKRSNLMRTHFGTVSKTEIEELMPLLDLRANYDALHIELEGKPSGYHASVESAALPGRTIEEELNDSIPDYDEAPPATTKARLLAAIPALSTYRASLEWQLAHADDYETLPKEERDEIHAAIVAHNAKIKPRLHVVS